VAERGGGALGWELPTRLAGPRDHLCRAEPSQDIAANRTRIGTTQPTRAGRSDRGVSDAARYFGKPQVGDEGRGSPPAGQHGFEILEATKAKRATKRELIVVATNHNRLVVEKGFLARTLP